MKKYYFLLFIFLSVMIFAVAYFSRQETDSRLLPEDEFMLQTSLAKTDEVNSGEQSEGSESADVCNSELGKPDRGVALTMELWIEKLVPLEKPSLEDYSGYTNARWTDDWLLTYNLEDEVTGETYDLQVTYYTDDDRQLSVRLRRNSNADVILVYDSDPELAIYSTRDVQTFLNTKRDMNYYLSYELPAGMEKGTFSFHLGNSGGEVFLCEGKEIAAEGELAWNEWNAAGGVMIEQGEPADRMEFTDGLLTGMPIIWNHSELLTQPEPLEDCAAPALLVKMDHDVFSISEIEDAKQNGQPIPAKNQTARIWYVFFAREGSSEMYYVYLNADYYSRDDVKELARSVKFTENAFP